MMKLHRKEGVTNGSAEAGDRGYFEFFLQKGRTVFPRNFFSVEFQNLRRCFEKSGGGSQALVSECSVFSIEIENTKSFFGSLSFG